MVLLHATHQLWVKVPFFFPPFFHCIYIWWTIKLWSNNGVVKDRDQSEGCVKVSNSFCGDMELKMLQRRKCVPVSQIIIDRNGVAAEGTRSHTSLWLGTLSFLSHPLYQIWHVIRTDYLVHAFMLRQDLFRECQKPFWPQRIMDGVSN